MVSNELLILIMILAVGIGFIASLFGIGGGFLLYPTMIFIAQMDVHSTVGTIPFVILFMALSSSIAYGRQKRIDYLIVAILAGASTIGAILGAYTSVQIPGQILVILFGIVEIILALILGLMKSPHEKQNKSKNEMIIEGNDLQGRKKWYIISRKKVDAQGQE
ncbi:MAG: sulfite exporter TauE/SafE family protein, partial [Candidatus Helarchaeota archaeon]